MAARGLGADFSPAMVVLARERHPDLEFVVGEASALLGEEKFDEGISMADKAAALAEQALDKAVEG